MLHRFRIALMNAVDAQSATAASAAAPSATPAPAPSAGEEWRNMSADAFKARLDEAGSSREKQLLKEFGVKTAAELKTALEEGKKLREAQMTEQQRLEAQVKELSPVAAKSKSMEEDIAFFLQAEEQAIPEDKRGLLELAPGAEQPGARLRWIASAKAKGLFGATAPAAAAGAAQGATRPPAPATTMAPPGPSTPPAPGTANHQAIYDGLKAKGQTIAAAAYRAQHRQQIK